ncbi:MAG TPA: hypothetical protein P5137_01065 [Candidatus Brocadiia bacterium]|nr:hypothetical protein [Candidatus Brocadiia bacterium]
MTSSPRAWFSVALCYCIGLALCLVVSCAAPGSKAEGGKVNLAKGASAGNVDTGAESSSQSPKVDKPTAGTVNVNTTYAALDRNVARAGVVAGLVFLGLLLAASAAPAPPDLRLQLGLYLAAAACWASALVMAWRFWPVD